MTQRVHHSKLRATQRALFATTAITLLLMAVYLCVRLTTLFTHGYTAADATMAALLFGAELFLCFHGVGYFMSVIKAERHQQNALPMLFSQYGSTTSRPGSGAAPPGIP